MNNSTYAVASHDPISIIHRCSNIPTTPCALLLLCTAGCTAGCTACFPPFTFCITAVVFTPPTAPVVAVPAGVVAIGAVPVAAVATDAVPAGAMANAAVLTVMCGIHDAGNLARLHRALLVACQVK